MTNFLELFSNPSIAKIVIIAAVVGVLVSLCASLLGVSLVLKRYSMIGDGLSHVGYGALAIATALNLSGDYTLEISLPIVVIAAFLLLRLSNNSRINNDSAIALLSVGAMAIGTIIFSLTGASAGDACNSLFGSASLITLNEKDMYISIAIAVLVLLFYIVFYNRIFSVTFDEDFSKASGINVKFINSALALLTAVTIVLGMQLMGAILVSGLIIFPSLTAMRVCRSFKGTVITAAAISITSFIVGFLSACLLNLQTGPAVIAVNIVAFVIFNVIGKLTKRS